jgi:energy-coupling factor transporter transmembrane protein EcfT
MERAERVYQAMLSRGFSGKLHSTRPYSFTAADAAFLGSTVVLLYLFRAHDVVGAVGRISMRVF